MDRPVIERVVEPAVGRSDVAREHPGEAAACFVIAPDPNEGDLRREVLNRRVDEGDERSCFVAQLNIQPMTFSISQYLL